MRFDERLSAALSESAQGIRPPRFTGADIIGRARGHWRRRLAALLAAVIVLAGAVAIRNALAPAEVFTPGCLSFGAGAVPSIANRQLGSDLAKVWNDLPIGGTVNGWAVTGDHRLHATGASPMKVPEWAVTQLHRAKNGWIGGDLAAAYFPKVGQGWQTIDTTGETILAMPGGGEMLARRIGSFAMVRRVDDLSEVARLNVGDNLATASDIKDTRLGWFAGDLLVLVTIDRDNPGNHAGTLMWNWKTNQVVKLPGYRALDVADNGTILLISGQSLFIAEPGTGFTAARVGCFSGRVRNWWLSPDGSRVAMVPQEAFRIPYLLELPVSELDADWRREATLIWLAVNAQDVVWQPDHLVLTVAEPMNTAVIRCGYRERQDQCERMRLPSGDLVALSAEVLPF